VDLEEALVCGDQRQVVDPGRRCDEAVGGILVRERETRSGEDTNASLIQCSGDRSSLILPFSVRRSTSRTLMGDNHSSDPADWRVEETFFDSRSGSATLQTQM
jgi:hypothetical protein